MNNFKNRIRLNSTEDEIVNYYDKNGNKIGTVEREEGIEKGLLLKAVQIWIINPETKQVLMQERSYKKVNDPGMIDVSASGHVQTGEAPMQAIIREGKEELGERAFEKLIPTIKKLNEFEIDFSKDGRKGKYLTYEYLAYSCEKLEAYTKQDSEVEKLFFMDYELMMNGNVKIGTYAPDFEANSTMGPITLNQYKGKWVVLFSHPGDFTPVKS